MKHLCHAPGCKVEVPPKIFMCLPHWRRLPAKMRREIWACYRPGQEVDKNPSLEYLQAAQRARAYIADLESGAAKAQKELFP